LQENFSPAAYLGYHLDVNDDNLLITNPASVSSNFGLTCAHEGYPGHMYQSLYTRNATEHIYMVLSDSIGYNEGWTTYVEAYSARYFSDNTDLNTIIAIENSLNTLLMARFDIGIHAEGWDIDDCVAYASSTLGYSLAASDLQEIYNIIVLDPGYAVKYGIGNMITNSIMSQAHIDFPDATDLQIHTAYLNALTGTYEQITYYMYEELSGN